MSGIGKIRVESQKQPEDFLKRPSHGSGFSKNKNYAKVPLPEGEDALKKVSDFPRPLELNISLG